MNFLSYTLNRSYFIICLIFSTVAWGQKADFNVDLTEGCAPLRVIFADQSSGTPISWEWTFGQRVNNKSSLQSPTVTYSRPGNYEITLKVGYAASPDDMITKTGYIRVKASPVIAFDTDIKNGCLPLIVNFQNTSSTAEGTITRWEWILGDGNITRQQSPSHTYETSGNKSVTLSATNSLGCNAVLTKPSLIAIQDTRMSFTPSATALCTEPSTITFTNTSTGTGNPEYLWDFGDGTSSIEENPQHTYRQKGEYVISLSIRGTTNCVAKTTIQLADNPAPDFTIDLPSQCIGATIGLQSTSPGVTSWMWNLGDGRTQNSTNGQFSAAYNTAGRYNITLTTTYRNGCVGSRTQQVDIVPFPTPDFLVRGCSQEKEFTFIDNPAKTIVSWIWTLGDGNNSFSKNPTHQYASQGAYKVRLVVVDNFNCRGEVIKDILSYKEPVANFLPNTLNECSGETLGGCAPHTINFEDKSDFGTPETGWVGEWDFGDGTKSNEQNPSHTFKNPGQYTVTLTITNDINCQAKMSRTVEVTDTAPAANFSIDKQRACIGEEVKFTGTSTDVDNWCWEVDGQNLTGQSPTYKFENIGSHDITLIAKKVGCGTPVTIPNAIFIEQPDPEYNITVNCADPYEITITNVSSGADSWEWDFGDMQTDNQSFNPTHRYNATGDYEINLRITNNTSRCIVNNKESVTIVELMADFSATPLVGCRNLNVQFNDQSTFADSLVWDFGDGPMLFGRADARNPRKFYDRPGVYDVTLKAIDINGCERVKTSNNYINILDIVGDFTSTIVASRCNELDVQFQDQSVGVPPVTRWLWDFGDGSTSTEQNPSHTYTALGQYNVSLTLTNLAGQCPIIKTNNIVFTNPIPDFTTNKAVHCINESIPLINRSRNSSTYSWTFEEHPPSVLSSPAVRYSRADQFDVTLTATDAYGCSQSLTKTNALSITEISADFTANNVSSECPPLVATFTETASKRPVAWAWEFGDGGKANIQNPTYSYIAPGSYAVTLTVVDQYGCSGTVIKDDFIFVDGPVGSVAVGNKGCIDTAIEFTSETTNAISFMWDFGDGGSSTVENTTHSYSNAGTYLPILRIEDTKGCVVYINAPSEITIFPLPTLDFTWTDPYPFTGENVLFNGNGDEIMEWEWDFEEQGQGSGKEVSYIFSKYGFLPISVSGTDKNGCINRTEKEVYVQDELRFIPNVFTPNNDSKNATFNILEVENGIWDIILYNRYGKKVYEALEYQGGWNGGDLAPGVYFYQIKNRYREEFSYKGYVQIL